MKRGLAARQLVSRGQGWGPYASLLLPSVAESAAASCCQGHFNDEHVLNSFAYLATAFQGRGA